MTPAPSPSTSPATASSGRRATAWATIALSLLLVAAVLALRSHHAPPSGLEGQRVPIATLPRLWPEAPPEPTRVEVGAASQNPTLLHFWGPSCPPCVAHGGDIDDLARGAAADGFAMWTLSADEPAEIRALMAKKSWTFPVLHDAALAAHAAFRVSALPAAFALDRAGVVRRAFPADARTEDVRQAMRALVAAAD